MSKNLVAYFSASGATKQVAQNLSQAISSDIYEIQPKVKYTDADLNWMDKQARSTIEMADKSFRPKIVEDNFDISEYDTIFLGFPIWWYVAPTIINTFLERYDLSNKKIILFATSGGSKFGKTVEDLRVSVSDSTKIIEGGILNGSPSVEQLKSWAEKLLE